METEHMEPDPSDAEARNDRGTTARPGIPGPASGLDAGRVYRQACEHQAAASASSYDMEPGLERLVTWMDGVTELRRAVARPAQPPYRSTGSPQIGAQPAYITDREPWPENSFVALLSEAERDALLSAGTSVRFADDEVLMTQGDIGDFLYVLTHGLVKVTVAADSGTQTTLAVRSRGDLVGEFGMLDHGPRTATAQAVGTVTAVQVGRDAYDALTSQYPALLPAITRYMLAKMRASTERRAAERVWPSRALLAQVVCELAEEYGERDPEGKVRLPFTQSEVGQFAGVAVSTAERVLAEFRRKGAIATMYGAILVRDLAFLKSIRFLDEDHKNS